MDYGDLLQAIQQSCQDMGLQAVDSFVAKCIQLYETTLVRHGLMLVGPTMGGKTVCYRVLQKVTLMLLLDCHQICLTNTQYSINASVTFASASHTSVLKYAVLVATLVSQICGQT